MMILIDSVHVCGAAATVAGITSARAGNRATLRPGSLLRQLTA